MIRLAATIRNLGEVGEESEMLMAEYDATRGDAMADEAAAYYALALTSSADAMRGIGRAR